MQLAGGLTSNIKLHFSVLMYLQSPSDLCGKVEEGDEVVQVNYQTVVSFPLFVSFFMHLFVYFYFHFFEEYTLKLPCTKSQGDSNSHDHNWYM